jgi:hypothetical protein
MTKVLKEKRENGMKVSKDVYVEEALNVIDDLRSQDIG